MDPLGPKLPEFQSKDQGESSQTPAWRSAARRPNPFREFGDRIARERQESAQRLADLEVVRRQNAATETQTAAAYAAARSRFQQTRENAEQNRMARARSATQQAGQFITHDIGSSSGASRAQNVAQANITQGNARLQARTNPTQQAGNSLEILGIRPGNFSNSLEATFGLGASGRAFNLDDIRAAIYDDHFRNSASAQPIHEQHDNIRDFSVAPNYDHKVTIDDQASTAIHQEAMDHLEREAAAHADIAANIGDKMAPLVGNEPLLNTLDRAMAYIDKRDSELIATFSEKYGLDTEEAKLHPFDYLFNGLLQEPTLPTLRALASNNPHLEAFRGDHLQTRQKLLADASGIFLLRKVQYQRPTNLEKAARVGGGLAIDGLGGMGLGGALAAGTSVPLHLGIAAGNVIATSSFMAKAADFQKISRADALKSLQFDVYKQAQSSPALMINTTNHLYSEASMKNLNELLGENARLLRKSSRKIDSLLSTYLNALRTIDRDMGESAEHAFDRVEGRRYSRELFAEILRENRLLQEVSNRAQYLAG